MRPHGWVADRLFALAMADNIVWRWNGPPTADSFALTLQQPGSEHFAIVRADGKVAGHAALYGHNMTHRTAFFEASLIRERKRPIGWGVGAVALSMWFLLGRHDVRKLYIETTDARASQFSSLVRRGIFRVEGRLSDHVFTGGQYHDAIILASAGDDVRRYLARQWAPHFDLKGLNRV